MHVKQSDGAAGEEEPETGMDVKTEAVTKNAAEAVAKVRHFPLARLSALSSLSLSLCFLPCCLVAVLIATGVLCNLCG